MAQASFNHVERHVQKIKLYGENRSFISVSSVNKGKTKPTKHSYRIPRRRQVMEDSSEIDEVPISDPQATHPRTWSESSASLADQLISPTSAGSGYSLETSAIQWFGVDIGGTLVKCVYYETQDGEEVLVADEEGASGGTRHHKDEGTNALKNFIKSSLTYGSTGIRDQRLEMNDVKIGGQEGTLHFIKFATVRMEGFFDMVTKNGLSRFPKIVCATGGGAFKFEKDFKKHLGVNLHKFDELQCLIRGLHYLTRHFPDECYYWENPNQPSTKKVPFELTPDLYPYIIVNIGSGVSILLVNSATDFKRIGGTSVGGGTFLGLSALLAGTESFEDAIALAEKGDSNRVDKLVRDIFGGDYTQFGLSGDVVASSFGHMMHPERRKEARPEDLAKATLVTVTNNIGAIAKMCASISEVERVIFVGNYLCGNKMSMQMLAYAMDYWSGNTVRALFLEHEGYFGALGSMLFHLDPDCRQ